MIIRHLPYFAVAAEEENLQRAAVRLGISQPALSRRIRDLENELGVLLFERVSGRLKLTPSGRQLGEESRRLIREVETLERSIRSRSTRHAVLAVGMNERAIALPSVAAALRKFRQDNPAVDLTVKVMPSSRQLAALKERGMDVGLMYCDSVSLPLRSAPIRSDDPFMLVLPAEHPLATSETVTLAQIDGEDLIWPSRDRVPASYDYLLAQWRAAGFLPHVTTEIANADAAIHAVRAGLGLALLRSSTADVGFPGVCFRPVAELAADSLGLSAVWVEQHNNVLTRRFLRLLADFKLMDDYDQS